MGVTYVENVKEDNDGHQSQIDLPDQGLFLCLPFLRSRIERTACDHIDVFYRDGILDGGGGGVVEFVATTVGGVVLVAHLFVSLSDQIGRDV